MRDDGEAACDVAAAAAVDDMERGVADDVCGVEVAAWVVCLLGCWADAAALEREAGVCRKAAKKVDRKKGRCDDMVSFRGGTRGKVVFRGRMVSRPSRGLEFSMWRGRWPGCDICFLGHRVRQCTRLRAVVGVWTVGVGLSLMSSAVSMAAWAGGGVYRGRRGGAWFFATAATGGRCEAIAAAGFGDTESRTGGCTQRSPRCWSAWVVRVLGSCWQREGALVEA